MAQNSNAVQASLNLKNPHDHDEEQGLANGSRSNNEITPTVPSICGIPLKHVSYVVMTRCIVLNQLTIFLVW